MTASFNPHTVAQQARRSMAVCGQGVVMVGAVAALAACMGRAPQPVATVQPQDQMMDCTAIYAEVASNNQRVTQLSKDQGWKVAQNVAAGVGGFVPVLWFGMDWQGTASTEAAALQSRQQYLGALAVQKHCGGAAPRPTGSRTPR
jgi:hypothetical protein